MIKKNIKVISMFILGVVSALCAAFAYSISSKNILINDSNWNVKNVEDAVSYLKDENSCAGLKPIKLISGNINTVGSIVKIGKEEFYVIGQGTGEEAGKTKLFAKYCIKDNNQVSSSATGTSFSESNYWNGKVGTSQKYPGSYSGNPYPYIYDENSNLYSIVNNYVKKISNYGIDNVTGRLMSYEEANSLSLDIRKSAGTSTYWLGSAYGESRVWRVGNAGGINNQYIDWNEYNTVRGIRPVILVPTNQIG